MESRLSDQSTTTPPLTPPVLVRGGGDLGTGVTLALRDRGWPVVIVDQPLPGALRLHVALAYAAVKGQWQVAGVQARLAPDLGALDSILAAGHVPVWTGSWRAAAAHLKVATLVDARMRGLSDADLRPADAAMIIGLGPGWRAGQHCHAVIETSRGATLGQVLLRGQASAHTGIPGSVMNLTHERILRTPVAGVLRRVCELGDLVRPGQTVATVSDSPIAATIGGLVRGLKLDGVLVGVGHKVGDIDPRADARLLAEPTDKAHRVGRAVVEAIDTLRARQRTESDPNAVAWSNACT